ncbi:ATP-grasp domain-containing protein [Streptomyces sp. NPDC048506]|uniref:ATP-grasp domain-containing protein n=1 Tax=Streptomyces sp. NPDC048506 TaxID=3155028 RepID=UPI0034168AB5
MTTGPSRPGLLLVGGAGPVSLSEAVAAQALAQAGAHGLHTHLTNQAEALKAAPALSELADAASTVDFTEPGVSAGWARDRVTAGESFDVVLGVREYAQVAVAETAAALGLPGNPPEAVRTVRVKDDCRAVLAAAGFRQPAFRVCSGAEEAADFLRASGGPWIVKPRDAMGSLGVSRVTGPGELDAALDALPDSSAPFLVEEFVEGPEYSVEGLFLDGQPRVLAVTAKEVMAPPLFVELGHVMPAVLPDEARTEMEQQVVAALRHLGLRFGVFHVELWLTPDGVVLGEVHVRIGGDWIHLLLEHVIEGLDLFGRVCDDALGRPAATGPLTPTRGAAVRFLVAPQGRLERIDGWQQVVDHPAVLHAELDVRPGDLIGPVRDSGSRSAVIVVGADTADEARRIAGELASAVHFTVSPAQES